MKPNSYSDLHFSYLSYWVNFAIFCLLLWCQLYFFSFAFDFFLVIVLIFLIFTFFTFSPGYTFFLFLLTAIIFDSLTPYYLGLWTLTMLLIIFLLCRYLDKQSRYSQVLIGEIVILIFFSGLFFIMFFLRHQPLNLWSFLISYLTSALLLAGIWVISAKFN